MTGRHALPDFTTTRATDSGADRWPFIVTADGEPAARVTDQDTADYAVNQAEQITATGWPPVVSVVRGLQESHATEGGTDWPGWIAWCDWLDLQQTETEAAGGDRP
jgi:hypothetical protein